MNTHEITQPKQGPLQKAAYFYINQIYTTLDRARNTPRIEHDKVNWEKLEQRRLYNFQNHLFITKTNEIDLGISMKQIWDEVYQDLYQMVKGLELPDDEEMTDNDFTFTDIMNINNLQKAINNLPEKYPWKVKEFNDKGIDFTIIGRLNLWDFKEDCIRTMNELDVLIYIRPVQPDGIEDNGSRVANQYYQYAVDAQFKLWLERVFIPNIKGLTYIMIDFWDLERRKAVVKQYIEMAMLKKIQK